MYRIGGYIGLGYSLFFGIISITEGQPTYNGEPITYNGQIIKTMADLIEIMDKRTVTATLLADADLTVDGTMVAGAALDPSEPVTTLTSRGASVYDNDGREIKNFSYGTGTQVIVQPDGEEREIKITYNI